MQTSFSSILFNSVVILVLIWLVVLIVSLLKLARRKDLFAPVKYLWAAIIVFAPVAGLIAYLIYGSKKRLKLIK